MAAEPPNPIVNALVILPDIEKRLEAFVRLGHGIVVFPGGVGTAEEILYLLGILLDPANAEQPLPVIFTGPAAAADYFAQLHEFVGLTLGPAAQQRYRIIIDDEAEVARVMNAGLDHVRAHRRQHSELLGRGQRYARAYLSVEERRHLHQWRDVLDLLDQCHR